MSNKEATVLASWVLSITRMLSAQGLNISELLDDADIDPAVLQVPSARVPAKSLKRLWRMAAKLTGREDLGLEMANHITSTTMYVYELAFQSAQTPRDALILTQQYGPVIYSESAYKVEETSDELIVSQSYGDVGELPSAESQDAAFAVGAKLMKEMFSHIDGIYKSVELVRAQPKDPSPYEGLLPCKVSFGHDKTCYRFDLAVVDQKLPTANPASRAAAGELLSQYMSSLTRGDIEKRTRDAITELLQEGSVCLKSVAAHIGMSERNLNRRLSDKEISFKKLWDDERKQNAIRLLREDENSITAIAYRLGYKDASSFSRAFKRWTGEKPMDVRRAIAGA